MTNRAAVFLLCACFLPLPPPAYAENIVWSGWTRIQRLYPAADSLIFITEYTNSGLSTCDGGGRFSLDQKNPDYRTQAAALIAAFTTNREITMAIVQGTPSCQAMVNRFQVR